MEICEVIDLKKYPLLESEMLKAGIKKKQIAQQIGITEKALTNKLSGKAPFKWVEVCTLQESFFPHVGLKELFTEADQAS